MFCLSRRRIPNPGFSEDDTLPVGREPDRIKAEIKALKRIRDSHREALGPKFISSKFWKQVEKQWVKGGYVGEITWHYTYVRLLLVSISRAEGQDSSGFPKSTYISLANAV